MNKTLRHFFCVLATICCVTIFFEGMTLGQSAKDIKFKHAMREARRFDPMYGKPSERSRKKAVALYYKALRHRPNDPNNIKIEHRIAQLYAFYGNPKTGERPKPKAAAGVFERIIKHYPANQLAWVECNIGLASCRMMMGKTEEAITAYKRVLEINPDSITGSEEERQRTKEIIKYLRVKMVDKVAYAARRIKNPETYTLQMQDIAQKYPGTDMARKAKQRLIAVCMIKSNAIVWDLGVDVLDLSSSDLSPDRH